MLKTEDLYKTGRFIKPHGIKGELTLATDTDLSFFSDNSDAYLICEMDGIPVPFFIDSFRQKNSVMAFVKLSDIDSEAKAKAFIGKPAYLPAEMKMEQDGDLPEWEQLIGYTASDEAVGKIGRVNGVNSQTINILLMVDYQGHEMLIPVAFITDSDPEQKIITLNLPEGFLEI